MKAGTRVQFSYRGARGLHGVVLWLDGVWAQVRWFAAGFPVQRVHQSHLVEEI